MSHEQSKNNIKTEKEFKFALDQQAKKSASQLSEQSLRKAVKDDAQLFNKNKMPKS
ncbi:hypothetical protein SAMN05660831_01364 [Thiohalospira halophila DSM 15071]|uniref:Uncharacterized protein n=1 Tax=Thiohalospira halophila DSM 15071 TaxID=1123397 RepID=A0A1I1R830_9GAMM|nr:hypothetical protein [Thiohalospira halophila]SFD30511.1 hypothetical protein SAMN05660831_01364 [Thiohalospira halophila DSM 15071]